MMEKKIKYNLFYAAVIIVAYHFLIPEITGAIIVSIVAIKSIFRFREGIFFWCSISYFLYTISTMFFAVSVGIILLGLIPKAFAKFSPKVLAALICVCLSMIFSFSYGYKSQIISMLLTFSNILVFVCLFFSYHEMKDYISLVDSFWYGAIILAGCTLFSIMNGGAGEYERLGFEDSVRSLANGMIFPLFFKSIDWLDGKNRCSLPKWLQSFLFIVFLVLLMLTLAKGAIFSLAIVIFIYALINKKINYKFIIAVSALFICAYLAQAQGSIDFSRFSERNADLNGRTEIWTFYFDHLFRRGTLGFWFGFGPGNVQRIAPYEYLGQYYAHSTVLDFFFSYGFVGFFLFSLLIIYLFTICIKKNNNIGMTMLVLSILTYSITGASTNTQIFIAFYAVMLSQVATSSAGVLKTPRIRKNAAINMNYK